MINKKQSKKKTVSFFWRH